MSELVHAVRVYGDEHRMGECEVLFLRWVVPEVCNEQDPEKEVIVVGVVRIALVLANCTQGIIR